MQPVVYLAADIEGDRETRVDRSAEEFDPPRLQAAGRARLGRTGL